MKAKLIDVAWIMFYIALAIPEMVMINLMFFLPLVQIIVNVGMILEFSLWLKGTVILSAEEFTPRFMLCMALNVITPVYTIGVWHLRAEKTEWSAWIVAGIALLFPALTVCVFIIGGDRNQVLHDVIATLAASSTIAGGIAWKVYPLFRRYLKEGPDTFWF